MNFKPTLLKTIVSILVALISNYFVVIFMAGCVGFFNCYLYALTDTWYIWISVLIIVYIAYSLFQKKK